MRISLKTEIAPRLVGHHGLFAMLKLNERFFSVGSSTLIIGIT
jgi:hypothetical protein